MHISQSNQINAHELSQTPPCFSSFNKGGGRGGPSKWYWEGHLSLYGELRPPPPNTTYHLRGGPSKPPSPAKPPPQIHKTAFFSSFDQSTSESDSGKMGRNFEKQREVFLHNRLKNKNLSHFFHRCHKLGESKPSLSPIFHFFVFSCFSHDFAGAVSVRWR
jgi:hypothetical protein